MERERVKCYLVNFSHCVRRDEAVGREFSPIQHLFCLIRVRNVNGRGCESLSRPRKCYLTPLELEKNVNFRDNKNCCFHCGCWLWICEGAECCWGPQLTLGGRDKSWGCEITTTLCIEKGVSHVSGWECWWGNWR